MILICTLVQFKNNSMIKNENSSDKWGVPVEQYGTYYI